MQSEMWKLQPPAFSRRLRGSKNRACPKKPPERRLQARLPAPQNWQNIGRTTLAGHFRYALEAGKIALLENGRGAFQVEQEGQRERLAAIEPHGLARLALPWDPLQSIAGAAGLETVGVAEEAEGRPQPVVGDETKVAAAQVACEFGAADGTPGPGEVLRFPARAAGSQNLPVQAETKVAAAQVACEFAAADGTPGPGEVLRFPARAAGSQNLPVQAETKVAA